MTNGRDRHHYALFACLLAPGGSNGPFTRMRLLLSVVRFIPVWFVLFVAVKTKVGGAGDRFDDYLCVDCVDLPSVKFTTSIEKISKFRPNMPF